MKRVLIVKTTSMGDVIHALPAIQDLVQQMPDVHIDWLVEASFSDIPALHPAVSDVLVVAVRRWKKSWWRWRTWQEIAAIRRILRGRQYDAIIDLQGLLKSAWLASWANGPRFGYDRNSIREPLASTWYHHRFEIAYAQHAVQRMRMLMALSMGYPCPDTLPDYGLQSQRTTTVQAYTGANWFALHATSRDSKLWPETHWIALGQVLAERGLVMQLPWANLAEQARAQRIAAAVPGAQVMPRQSLQALAAMLAQAKFAVGVDTGLSHLAAALDVPVVAIYTDTTPARTGVAAGLRVPAANLGGERQLPPVTAVLEVLGHWQLYA